MLFYDFGSTNSPLAEIIQKIEEGKAALSGLFHFALIFFCLAFENLKIGSSIYGIDISFFHAQLTLKSYGIFD